MDADSILENFFLALPSLRNHHAPGSHAYALLKRVARKEVEHLFLGQDALARTFQPFGDLVFPYYRMGAVDSLNLFDLDELIIFSFYWANRTRYKRVVDVGANIGLHSIVLTKCGFEVLAYEPDPQHFQVLQRNLALNDSANVRAVNAAVSSQAGEMEFVRVLGNTTGSHLAGSKPNPYGDLEKLPVKLDPIGPLVAWADLIKIDVEGHEKEVLLATDREDWLDTDALVEVGSESNAVSIYEHFTALGIQLFSQKIGWRKVVDMQGMPISHHDGTLFVTGKHEMPWG